MTESKNEELKALAMDWAEKIVMEITTSLHDPLVKLQGEAEDIYKRYSVFGAFDKLGSDEGDDIDQVVINMLASSRYNHLLYLKKHPNRPTSKWEKVTGQALKNQNR